MNNNNIPTNDILFEQLLWRELEDDKWVPPLELFKFFDILDLAPEGKNWKALGAHLNYSNRELLKLKDSRNMFEDWRSRRVSYVIQVSRALEKMNNVEPLIILDNACRRRLEEDQLPSAQQQPTRQQPPQVQQPRPESFEEIRDRRGRRRKEEERVKNDHLICFRLLVLLSIIDNLHIIREM